MNTFWTSRSQKERRAIGVGAALVAVVLVVAFAWLPLERSRARLRTELPALRGSLSLLERQAAEVRRLKAMPVSTPGSAVPLNAIANSNPLAGAQLAALDDKRLRVTGADVGFTALLDWLAAVQASQGLRVESARLDALPAAGRVRAEITLSRS
jgi:general secretion pathway protein M